MPIGKFFEIAAEEKLRNENKSQTMTQLEKQSLEFLKELVDQDGNLYEEVRGAFWHHGTKKKIAREAKDLYQKLSTKEKLKSENK